ncbi:MAG: hypothetical protein RPS47_04850 [Colwellia sp.]
MPIQQLNRVLKHWPFNPEGITASKFLELVDKINALKHFKSVVQSQINIQFGSVQIHGDVNEVRSHLSSVNENEEDPHVFSVSWTINTNPRGSASISVNFTNNTIQVNAQHIDKSPAKEFKDIVLNFIPELPNVGPQQPKTVSNTTEQPVAQDVAYLPGAFRPVAMPTVSDNDVFIIMSFDKGQRDAYFVSIEPTLKSLGFNPIRVDQIQHNATVTPEIMRQIEKSVFIVADLTGERPNVYYEVGYSHRADKEVILVSKKSTAVHFDVAAINRIEYEDYTELSEALRKRVIGVCDRLGIVVPANNDS